MILVIKFIITLLGFVKWWRRKSENAVPKTNPQIDANWGKAYTNVPSYISGYVKKNSGIDASKNV